MAKHRFILVAPYLLVVAVSFYFSHFVADESRDLFDLPISGLLSLALTLPWSYVLLAVLRLGGQESNFVWVLCMAGGVALNAGILYCLGLKFERAPDRLA